MGSVRAGMVSVIFPGQGAQKVGMARELFSLSRAARAVFERADEIMDFSVSDLCFDGPASRLGMTEYCQPALFAAGFAALEALKESCPGFAPGMYAGHSLGEFTALSAGGAMSFEDGIMLVRRRGELMARAGEESKGAMYAVVGASLEEVNEACAGLAAYPANINCPGQVVISGKKDAAAEAASRLKRAGGKVMPLKVAGAFHSVYMEPAAAGLGSVLEDINFKRPDEPVYSNVTACRHGGESSIRERLREQLTSPVLWQAEVEKMADDGASVFIEAGPGKVLSKLVARILPGAKTFSVEDAESLDKASDFLRGPGGSKSLHGEKNGS